MVTDGLRIFDMADTTKNALTSWTVMPLCLSSSPSACDQVARKPLEPAYVASIADGTAAAKDPMLRISPFFLEVEKLMVWVGDAACQPCYSNIPRKKGRKDNLCHAQSRMDVDLQNVVDLLSFRLMEIHRHFMRPANIIDENADIEPIDSFGKAVKCFRVCLGKVNIVNLGGDLVFLL